MKAKIKALIDEKDGLRGLVPSRSFGMRDKVYGTYMTKLDPRNNPVVQHALAESEDPRFKEFLERIQERRYRRMALQTIAKGCNITLAEFGKWFNQASTQAAIATAQQASLKVVEDMVEDAMTVDVVCDRCDGMTWVAAPAGLPPETPGYRSMTGDGGIIVWIRDCPVCTLGKVRKPGDAHARDRTLEMAGLIKKGPGVVINQSFGNSHASAVNDLDCMTMDATFSSDESGG
jgi:hypothetical protein